MGISFQRSRLLIIVTTTLFLLTGLAISFFAAGTHQAHASGGGGFNQPGNVLITDQFNNRVIEVDRHKHIVWSFGSGNPSLCNPGPGTIIGTNGAERLAGGLTVIAGTGIPAGASSFLPNGCTNVIGNGPNQLDGPYTAFVIGDYTGQTPPPANF